MIHRVTNRYLLIVAIACASLASLYCAQADAEKPLTKQAKTVLRSFVTKKLQQGGLIYDAAFSDDTTALEALEPALKNIASFLKTIENPKLRQLVFFLVWEVPDIDKVFKGYDNSEIFKGLFTTSQAKGFDPKKTLDATFRRLITGAESVLNIINTLDDEGRAQLGSLLHMVQPFAASLVGVKKADFFRENLIPNISDEERKSLEVALSDVNLTDGDKVTALKRFLKPGAKDVNELLEEWKSLVMTEETPGNVAFFLQNKTLVVDAVEKFGDKKIEKSVDFFEKSGVSIPKEQLQRMWPTLKGLKKVFGYISAAKKALGLRHSVTNLVRNVQGKKDIDFKKDTIADATEFKDIFQASWLAEARKVSEGETGRLLWSAAAGGAQGLADFVTQVRSGEMRQKGSEVAQDLAVLVQKSLQDRKATQGELTVVQVIEKYALKAFQAARKKLVGAQSTLLADQDRIVVGNVAKGVKRTIADTLRTFQETLDEVVVDSLGQSRVGYLGAVATAVTEEAQGQVDQQAEMDFVLRYIGAQESENEPVSARSVVLALTKLSIAQVNQEFGNYGEEVRYKILALIKIAQVIEKNGVDITKLKDTTLTATIDKVIKAVKEQAKKSKKPMTVDFFQEQLDTSVVVKQIVAGLQKDFKSTELSVAIPPLVTQRTSTDVVTHEGEEPQQVPEQTPEKSDDPQSDFFKMDLAEFNKLYLAHFSGDIVPVGRTEGFTDNPVVDVLRTFPPKLASLAHAFLGLGSAKEIINHAITQPNGKKKVTKVVSAALKALFGGTRAQARDPLVNYVKSGVDAGFSLLNILETVKDEDRAHLLSLFEMLKPVQELAISAKLSTIFKALSTKEVFTLSQEDFDAQSTAEKMKFLHTYFDQRPDNALQEVFEPFDTIVKMTAKLDGTILLIKHQAAVEASLKQQNPEEYLAQRLSMDLAEAKRLLPEVRQIKKYLWWVGKARSVVRGVQKMCNFFRGKATKFDYERNHYATAQELTEDVKASPVGNIMKFLQTTQTGQRVTVGAKYLGEKIIWALQADGSGAITARVEQLVKDIKAKGISAQKIQPLIEFVKQFVPKETLKKVVKSAESALQEAGTLSTVGEAARAVLKALEEMKEFFTQPSEEQSAAESRDVTAVATGMVQEGSVDMGAVVMGDDTSSLLQGLQDRSVKLSTLEGAVARMAQQAQSLADVVDGKAPDSTMTQDEFAQRLYALAQLKVASDIPKDFTSDEYQTVVNAVVDAVQKLGDRKHKSAMQDATREVQLVDFGQKCDDSKNQNTISQVIQKAMTKIFDARKKAEARRPVVQQQVTEEFTQEMFNKETPQSLQARLKIVLSSKNKTAVNDLEELVGQLTKYAAQDPQHYVLLMDQVVQAITPGVKANSDTIERCQVLHKAFQKGVLPVLNSLKDPAIEKVQKWMKDTIRLGEEYLKEVGKYEDEIPAKVMTKVHLINMIILSYKNDRSIAAVSDITGLEKFQKMLKEMTKVIDVNFHMDKYDLGADQLKGVIDRLMVLTQDESADTQQECAVALRAMIQDSGANQKRVGKYLEQKIVQQQQKTAARGDTFEIDTDVSAGDRVDVTSLHSAGSTGLNESGSSFSVSDGKKGPQGNVTTSKGGQSSADIQRLRQQQEEEQRQREAADLKGHGSGTGMDEVIRPVVEGHA